jgi:hypothetical protein
LRRHDISVLELTRTCLAATVPNIGRAWDTHLWADPGTTFSSSQLIDATLEGGTLLLTNEQDPINRLGVAYLGANFGRQDLIVGRRMVDPPVNRGDNRMIPLTFEGATLRSDSGKAAKARI